jgi:glycosyltransferase involved in cell wall biosynthesis
VGRAEYLTVHAKLKLSVSIITLNEERNLARCLASVRDLAAEVVILDSGSTDRTKAIADEHGATFAVQPWLGYVAQKNAALRLCSQPWVLSLDADEELSPELATAIRQAIGGTEPAVNGFWLNRRTNYLGQWIWHALYPEWRLRLTRREGSEWRGQDVHEELTVTGQTGRLSGDLLHYPFRDFQEHLQSTLRYARLRANAYERLGRKFHWYQLLFSPWITFFKHLVLKQGWRDGWRGWLIATAKMINVAAKYAFLLEKRLGGHPDPMPSQPS